jgi:hypothetical protein
MLGGNPSCRSSTVQAHTHVHLIEISIVDGLGALRSNTYFVACDWYWSDGRNEAISGMTAARYVTARRQTVVFDFRHKVVREQEVSGRLWRSLVKQIRLLGRRVLVCIPDSFVRDVDVFSCKAEGKVLFQ